MSADDAEQQRVRRLAAVIRRPLVHGLRAYLNAGEQEAVVAALVDVIALILAPLIYAGLAEDDVLDNMDRILRESVKARIEQMPGKN